MLDPGSLQSWGTWPHPVNGFPKWKGFVGQHYQKQTWIQDALEKQQDLLET